MKAQDLRDFVDKLVLYGVHLATTLRLSTWLVFYDRYNIVLAYFFWRLAWARFCNICVGHPESGDEGNAMEARRDVCDELESDARI